MRILAVIGLLLWAAAAGAAEPALDLTIGGETRHFTRDQLLARPDVATIEVTKDAIYGRAMTYRAVPVAGLIAGLTPPPDTVIEAIATDGYAAQLPADQILSTDPKLVIAWVAIEPADAPWPTLPEKTVSAGTFYLVWTGDQAATVRSEQWPYQMAKLATQPSPAARWPELAVDSALTAADPIRSGQTLFVTQCLVCHKLNGAGSADVGPDLNRPMNPTEYLAPAALHALIRDPASVRDWPDRKMQGFTPEQMSDREIEQVIAYLHHMAGRKK
ncbi:c-type cytochrome [Mycobacterium sp. KBS0706]|uniref:c-type cytochrome n=1 Tax=Mycobacterium sp. KBS0706 TaxID=2578109 RepID=UPI00110F6D85|nr:c-type cytochrome [Mycobacterium sp. KBS0706]TSD87434.1 c-type cytochrome [Mycobacterium sp. KBS0706]